MMPLRESCAGGMKALQWGASSLPSIRCCSRSPRAASTGGEGQLSVIQIDEGTGARRYISGLYHCGSRRCARCSQSIAAERVNQLSRGLDWFMHDGLGDGIGHQVLFATFTIGHSLDDLPDKLMDALGHAGSALTAGGSWSEIPDPGRPEEIRSLQHDQHRRGHLELRQRLPFPPALSAAASAPPRVSVCMGDGRRA